MSLSGLLFVPVVTLLGLLSLALAMNGGVLGTLLGIGMVLSGAVGMTFFYREERKWIRCIKDHSDTVLRLKRNIVTDWVAEHRPEKLRLAETNYEKLVDDLIKEDDQIRLQKQTLRVLYPDQKPFLEKNYSDLLK